MFLDDMKNNDIDAYIDNIIANTKMLKKTDKEFSSCYNVTKENLLVEYDSILVISKDIIDTFLDDGSTLTGNPLGYLFSYSDIEDKDSLVGGLEVKIPDSLTIGYSMALDPTKKYCIYLIDSKSGLFTSNTSEQNVDNSYIAIKELLDSKFNLTRQLNYGDIPFVVAEICSNNSIKGFQMLIYELLVTGLSRDLNDASKEFRFQAKPNSKYNTFQMINVRDISRNTSAFTALVSENISKSILVALRKDKNDTQHAVISPQEQIALKKI